MKSKPILLIAAGLVVQLLVFVVTFRFYDTHNKTDEAVHEMVYERGITPFTAYLTGIGEVLPGGESTFVRGSNVAKVHVAIGSKVNAGDVLFALDNTLLKHQREERIAALAIAKAQQRQCEKGSDPLDLRVQEKELASLQAKKEAKEWQEKMFLSLYNEHVISEREKEDQASSRLLATLEYEKAKASYEKMQQGATAEEREIGVAKVREAETLLASVESQLEACSVRAPVAGKVLEINEHGVLLGDPTTNYLKVKIEARDAWRFSPTSALRAIAVHPTISKLYFLLQFVHVKPTIQKDDTVELLFSFQPGQALLYFGEKLDVFVEASPASEAGYLEAQFKRQ